MTSQPTTVFFSGFLEIRASYHLGCLTPLCWVRWGEWGGRSSGRVESALLLSVNKPDVWC